MIKVESLPVSIKALTRYLTFRLKFETMTVITKCVPTSLCVKAATYLLYVFTRELRVGPIGFCVVAILALVPTASHIFLPCLSILIGSNLPDFSHMVE